MTATHGVGTYGNAAGTVTPLDHKMAQLGLIVKTAANTIRAGLFWDGNSTVVSGKSNMSYDVRALTAVTSRGATSGAVLLTNDAVYNVATTAAPGSNSRYDVVYLWQREYSIDGTDSDPVIGVVQGTAAASPSVPSLSAYPGAIQLATILVPAGVTATNSGTTITQTAPFTALDGGTVVARTTTERDAYVPASTDLKARCFVLANSSTYQWNGSGWVILPPSPLIIPTVSGTGVSVDATTGLVTFTSATVITVDGAFLSAFRKTKISLQSLNNSGTATMIFRTAAPADDTSSKYDRTEILARNATVASATSVSQSSWTLVGVANTLVHAELEFVGAAAASPTTGFLKVGVHSNPAVQNTSNIFDEFYLTQQESTAFGGFKITFTAACSGTIRITGEI